ncbi:hypothetical protein ACH5RR_017828 [Cinchona calisaya]|uniref:Uncharacterized protein n=1 Tax=Cinchona calisaya TaxID=153742 RepID=A0ABD2ZKN3_9GENT
MGSLPFTPPSSPPPPPSPGNSASGYRIYASFCSREVEPNTVSVSNWLQCYDTCNNTWDYISPIPGLIENHVLKGFAMTSIGDSIYIIGGRLSRKGRVQSSYDDQFDEIDHQETGVEVVSNVLCYNIHTKEWSKCAPLSVPRYDFACCVCDSKIYVAGGQLELASARGIASTEVYDPFIDKWTLLPNMNRLRYKCVGVTWQGKVHVVGGFVQSYYIDRCSAEVYNVQSGTWDLVSGMWLLDVPPNQIVEVDGNLLSSGDCLNAWKGHIEFYDGKLNIWNVVERSQLKRFPSPNSAYCYGGEDNFQPIQRRYLTMAPVGSHLYFLAGYKMPGESSRTISVVHSFDTSAATTGYAWRSFEPMQEEGLRELCSHCCVVQLS